jgi:hypothetical protein
MENKQDDIKVIVTATDAISTSKTIETPGATTPNVEVLPMRWWVQVGVRVTRTYLQSLLGFLAAGGIGISTETVKALGVTDFSSLFLASASLAIAPAVVSLLQNAIEILSQLDAAYPKARA